MKKIDFEAFRNKYTLIPKGARYKGKQSFLLFKGKKRVTPNPTPYPEDYIRFEYEQYLNK